MDHDVIGVKFDRGGNSFLKHGQFTAGEHIYFESLHVKSYGGKFLGCPAFYYS